MEFSHVSVLAEECIQALNLRPDGVYVDGTTGGGGHSLRIAQQLGPAGRLICIARDEEALAAASRRLEAYRDRVDVYKIQTTDRVKESIFNIIQFDIEGRDVLDLFAGSGQMGIECLSRGAKSCTFVEMDPKAQQVVRRLSLIHISTWANPP